MLSGNRGCGTDGVRSAALRKIHSYCYNMSNESAKYATIHVCMSGSCWDDGSKSTLVELEELASVVGGCTIMEASCYGHCGHGPNALIERDNGREKMCNGLRSVENNVGAIKLATGRQPTLDKALHARLKLLRRVSGLEKKLMDAQMVLEVLECSPAQLGTPAARKKLDKALALVDGVIQEAGDAHPQLIARTVRRQVVALREGRPASPSSADITADDPEQVMGCWLLESVEPSSSHSAIFQLSSQDGARGKVSGADGSKTTWHVAMHVEDSDEDSPSVERVVLREYTPISTDEEWRAGVLRYCSSRLDVGRGNTFPLSV